MLEENTAKLNDIYYDGSTILSYNRILNFILGNRGCGKTYFFKNWCIKDFLKRGKEFVWVRRYKPEIKLMTSFFNDVYDRYPGVKFRVDGNKAYINDKVAGYFIPLSVSASFKSVPFPNVNKIIFDEFIIASRANKYIENEPAKFLDLFSTVARLRDDVRAFFIANSVSVSNPYFNYFKISPKSNKQFTSNEHCVIEYCVNQDFVDVAYSTRFGRLTKGTVYGEYAIENNFLLDNYNHVEPRSSTSIYKLTLTHLNQYYGVYFDYSKNLIYITRRKNLNGGLAIAVTVDDVEDNSVLAKSQNIREIINTIKEMFSLGRCRYETIKVKSGFYEIMRALNIK